MLRATLGTVEGASGAGETGGLEAAAAAGVIEAERDARARNAAEERAREAVAEQARALEAALVANVAKSHKLQKQFEGTPVLPTPKCTLARSICVGCRRKCDGPECPDFRSQMFVDEDGCRACRCMKVLPPVAAAASPPEVHQKKCTLARRICVGCGKKCTRGGKKCTEYREEMYADMDGCTACRCVALGNGTAPAVAIPDWNGADGGAPSTAADMADSTELSGAASAGEAAGAAALLAKIRREAAKASRGSGSESESESEGEGGSAKSTLSAEAAEDAEKVAVAKWKCLDMEAFVRHMNAATAACSHSDSTTECSKLQEQLFAGQGACYKELHAPVEAMGGHLAFQSCLREAVGANKLSVASAAFIVRVETCLAAAPPTAKTGKATEGGKLPTAADEVARKNGALQSVEPDSGGTGASCPSMTDFVARYDAAQLKCDTFSAKGAASPPVGKAADVCGTLKTHIDSGKGACNGALASIISMPTTVHTACLRAATESDAMSPVTTRFALQASVCHGDLHAPALPAPSGGCPMLASFVTQVRNVAAKCPSPGKGAGDQTVCGRFLDQLKPEAGECRLATSEIVNMDKAMYEQCVRQAAHGGLLDGPSARAIAQVEVCFEYPVPKCPSVSLYAQNVAASAKVCAVNVGKSQCDVLQTRLGGGDHPCQSESKGLLKLQGPDAKACLRVAMDARVLTEDAVRFVVFLDACQKQWYEGGDDAGSAGSADSAGSTAGSAAGSAAFRAQIRSRVNVAMGSTASPSVLVPTNSLEMKRTTDAERGEEALEAAELKKQDVEQRATHVKAEEERRDMNKARASADRAAVDLTHANDIALGDTTTATAAVPSTDASFLEQSEPFGEAPLKAAPAVNAASAPIVPQPVVVLVSNVSIRHNKFAMNEPEDLTMVRGIVTMAGLSPSTNLTGEAVAAIKAGLVGIMGLSNKTVITITTVPENETQAALTWHGVVANVSGVVQQVEIARPAGSVVPERVGTAGPAGSIVPLPVMRRRLLRVASHASHAKGRATFTDVCPETLEKLCKEISAARCFGAGACSPSGERTWAGVFTDCVSDRADRCAPCFPESACGTTQRVGEGARWYQQRVPAVRVSYTAKVAVHTAPAVVERVWAAQQDLAALGVLLRAIHAVGILRGVTAVELSRPVIVAPTPEPETFLAPPCAKLTTCKECSGTPICGWCASSSRCLQGNAAGSLIDGECPLVFANPSTADSVAGTPENWLYSPRSCPFRRARFTKLTPVVVPEHCVDGVQNDDEVRGRRSVWVCVVRWWVVSRRRRDSGRGIVGAVL